MPTNEDRPDFDAPARPERRFTASGGVQYEGETVFGLEPAGRSETDLDGLLAAALDDDRYVVGDWFDFPRPVFLVRDHEVGTAFRVVVRGDRIDCHLLPDTDTAALEALYARLEERCDADWRAEWEIREP